MKNSKYLLYIFVLSLIASSHSYSDICHEFFHSKYKRKVWDYISEDEARGLNKSYSKFLDVEKTNTKLDHLDKQYSELEDIYYNNMDSILDELDAMGVSYYSKQADFLEAVLIDELSVYSNRLVIEMKYILDSMNIESTIRKQFVHERVNYNYIEIFASSDSKSDAIKRLFRFKSKTNVDSISFDLLTNIKARFQGFQDPVARRIDLGLKGFRDIVGNDRISMLAKHELFHGIFSQKRLKGLDSIYHSNFVATGEKALSKIESGYSQFFSAEEVYNFANNPFWGADLLQSSLKIKNSKQFLFELNGAIDLVKDAQKLASQSQEIVGGFSHYIKNNSKDIHFSFMTENRQSFFSPNKAFYFEFTNPTNKLKTYNCISEKYKKPFSAIKSERKKAITKHLNGTKSKLTEKMQNKIIKEELKQMAPEYEEIFKLLEEDYKSLLKVSKVMQKEAKQLEIKTIQVYDDFAIRLESNPNYYRTAEAEVILTELRSDFRKLGNLVKEDYKGFAGR